MGLHEQRYRQVIKRLAEARRRLGLSQAAVAARLTFDPEQRARPTQSFVSKCETGERRLDAVELADFARVYGVSVAELLGEGGDQPPPDVVVGTESQEGAGARSAARRRGRGRGAR